MRITLLVVLVLPVLAACGVENPSSEFTVEPGAYARAFDAARETLREYRFTVNRVDARAGVITTQPKASAGFATPWDVEQSAPRQELEDLLSQHERRVRISFQPSGAPPDAPPDVDRLDASRAAPMIGRVEAVVDRVYVRGVRPSSKAILLSGHDTDPLAVAAGQPAQYAVPLSRDEYLEARLCDAIRRRLAAPERVAGN